MTDEEIKLCPKCQIKEPRHSRTCPTGKSYLVSSPAAYIEAAAHVRKTGETVQIGGGWMVRPVKED
jgi:hypothetical protein